MNPAPQEVTHLLRAWSSGDQTAFDKVMPLVYHELRQMAKRSTSGRTPGHTLQATALIHEAYLRMVNQKDTEWQSRSHFFSVAATAMRHILVDYARTKHAAKRGGQAFMVTLDEAANASDERAAELIALDDALGRLAATDSRKCQVVELKYFGGFTLEETAEVLNVSSETVARDWRLARTWLLRELSRTPR